MKGKSLIVLLLTVVALALLVWEISHSISSSSNKNKIAIVEKEKPVVPENTTFSTFWKKYIFEKNEASNTFYDKIVSTAEKADTIYPSDSSPAKQLKVFSDTAIATGKRICIFRPTSPDGKYGEWIILGENDKILTKYTAVKIDTTQIHNNKKIFIFKKEKTNVVLKDTIGMP